jgi:hypothetical protein
MLANDALSDRKDLVGTHILSVTVTKRRLIPDSVNGARLVVVGQGFIDIMLDVETIWTMPIENCPQSLYVCALPQRRTTRRGAPALALFSSPDLNPH